MKTEPTLSLSDLKRLREPLAEYGGLIESRLSCEFRSDLAAGIVATHNAADVLVEVAEAALAWSEAFGEYESMPIGLETDAFLAIRDNAMRARDRLRAALAKVTP